METNIIKEKIKEIEELENVMEKTKSKNDILKLYQTQTDKMFDLIVKFYNFEIHEKNENEPSNKIYHLGFKTGYAGKFKDSELRQLYSYVFNSIYFEDYDKDMRTKLAKIVFRKCAYFQNGELSLNVF